MIVLCGKTTDGQLVVRGTYAFYETYGIPLDVLFEVLKNHKCIPDWLDFMREAKEAGMNTSRIISKLDEAIADSYGSEIRDAIIKRLDLHESEKQFNSLFNCFPVYIKPYFL